MKGEKEWKAWSKSGQRPANIPSLPSSTYRDDGWISWPDWLGSENTSNQAKHANMLPFAAARAIVRKLKLKSMTEWKVWRKAGQRPSNIPSNPNGTYRDDGWISMPDWLGYGSEGGAVGSGSSSSSSSSSATQKKTKKTKKTKTKAKTKKKTRKTVAPQPPPPPRGSRRGNGRGRRLAPSPTATTTLLVAPAAGRRRRRSRWRWRRSAAFRS